MYRFLYIEDNLTDVYLFEEMINQGSGPPPCVLSHAPNLAKGLARLSEDEFDGVLLDLTLEDSRGLATLDRVVAHAPHAAVIVLTSSGDDSLGVQALEQGAQDYLVKDDVTLGSLSRAVRYSIERKRLTHELQLKLREIEIAMAEVRQLRGLIRICAACKKVVTQQGDWQAIESYVREHTEADFTHGYCPDCALEVEREMDQTFAPKERYSDT